MDVRIKDYVCVTPFKSSQYVIMNFSLTFSLKFSLNRSLNICVVISPYNDKQISLKPSENIFKYASELSKQIYKYIMLDVWTRLITK